MQQIRTTTSILRCLLNKDAAVSSVFKVVVVNPTSHQLCASCTVFGRHDTIIDFNEVDMSICLPEQ